MPLGKGQASYLNAKWDQPSKFDRPGRLFSCNSSSFWSLRLSRRIVWTTPITVANAPMEATISSAITIISDSLLRGKELSLDNKVPVGGFYSKNTYTDLRLYRKPDRPPSDIPNGHYNRWALFASTDFSGRYTWRACWQRYPEHEAWSYTLSLILTETSCRSRYPDEIISPALKSGHQNALFSSMFVNFAVPVKLVFTPFLPKFTN